MDCSCDIHGAQRHCVFDKGLPGSLGLVVCKLPAKLEAVAAVDAAAAVLLVILKVAGKAVAAVQYLKPESMALTRLVRITHEPVSTRRGQPDLGDLPTNLHELTTGRLDLL